MKNPTLNRNIVKYNLPHILDGVLLNTHELRIKNLQEYQQQVHIFTLVPSRTSNIVENNIIHQTWWSHSAWMAKACLQVSDFLFIRM